MSPSKPPAKAGERQPSNPELVKQLQREAEARKREAAALDRAAEKLQSGEHPLPADYEQQVDQEVVTPTDTPVPERRRRQFSTAFKASLAAIGGALSGAAVIAAVTLWAGSGKADAAEARKTAEAADASVRVLEPRVVRLETQQANTAKDVEEIKKAVKEQGDKMAGALDANTKALQAVLSKLK